MQQGSVIREHRKLGPDVWCFRVGSVDFLHQSYGKLPSRCCVTHLLGSSQDDSAMHSVTVRSCFPPSRAWPVERTNLALYQEGLSRLP
jgi:hypothetical protein